MPLSKVKQAKWMRSYRARRCLIGITAKETRGIGSSVIPNISQAVGSMVTPNYNDKFHRGDIDADGNPIPEY